jgi:hypothetical protein
MINLVNHQCKQEALKKCLVLFIYCTGERKANYCGGSVATVKQIRQENRERSYAG